MSKAEERRAFRDARRSYAFSGGNRHVQLLDPDFDQLPEAPFRNGEPMDLVDIYKRQDA